jgi:squalene synthase HpnC
VVRALAPAVAECAIPEQPFRDLIEANRQDQAVTRYQSFDGLLAYCTLSANPVGRIVLHVFGVATPQREILSDRVCTALQLAEHWQDVAEDLRAGRVYLPAEDLDRFGCTERDLAASHAAPQVRALMSFEEKRARALLDKGAPLVGTLRGAARVAVAGYVAGGRAALAAIAAADHDVLRATHRPGKRRLATEMLRAYATGR